MIEKVKKYGIIIIMAILFTAFSFSIVELVMESPEYNDYCRPSIVSMEPGDEKQVEYDKCQDDYDSARAQHSVAGFIITAIFGVIAIIAGMYVHSKNEVVEWIFSGLLIGGIMTIFVGNLAYFNDMSRFAKPAILLVEMGLIVWIAVKTATSKPRKK